MLSCDLGDKVRLNARFSDSDGNLLDPGTIVAIVQDNQGVQTSYSYNPGLIVRQSLGVYYVDHEPLRQGLHNFRWTSTGSGQASEEDVFYVTPRKVTP